MKRVRRRGNVKMLELYSSMIADMLICSLVGSLNKIPLSIAGIILFNVPTSLENSASIFFGKLNPADSAEFSSQFIFIRQHEETFRPFYA